MPAVGVPTPPLYDANVVAVAKRAADRAIADLLSGASGPRGVHVPAPAGAGKSDLVSRAVGRARALGLRVAVAAPTNEQAFGLVRTIALLHCRTGGQTVTFVPARNVSLPDAVRRLPGVQEREARAAAGESLIVGTLSKLGDAFARGSLPPFDVLLVDESYQADAAKYYAVGDLAPVHLLVGDGGQISPFSTIEEPCRWRGLPEDPLQTAVGVLRRNHPATPVYGLPITRRLDGRAVRVARLFYPELPFAPAVLPGVRALRLRRAPAADPGLRPLDQALDLAAREGWAHVELPRAAVLQADPEAVWLLGALVRRLLDRGPQVRCERQPRSASLRPEQVAVGVSHNDQKDFLRMALDGAGLSGVVVETANKLQGLEFEVVLVWHPLAGLPEADGFHLDPGRLCVLLTRHRQACVVVGRAGDRDLLEDQVPPPTAAYLGWDPDPVLDGWEVHRDVFAALEPFRVGE
jgi:AAA domain